VLFVYPPPKNTFQRRVFPQKNNVTFPGYPGDPGKTKPEKLLNNHPKIKDPGGDPWILHFSNAPRQKMYFGGILGNQFWRR
jgi:hypothetical protein